MKRILLAGAIFLSGCGRNPTNQAGQLLPLSSSERGKALMGQLGCPSCHVIPGVRGANGHVGPPLSQISLRTYLAGRILNSPENMIRWIRHPKSVDEKTAMPEMNIGERDARDIASYLLQLR